MEKQVSLKRSLSLPMLTLYGLGTTIGAGIYALVGEIAGLAGYYAPLSFLFASILAGFTALSFAELSSRYPRAAGAALYIKQGFGSVKLSTLIGLFVISAGLVSAAALINGLFAHIQQFIEADRFTSILLITLTLGVIAAWGISESVTVASIITLIEIGGLLMVISVSSDAFSSLSTRWTELIPSASLMSWQGIFLGTLLSFYAFIGFEDMVDVAEEVKDVKRKLPLAIILTLVITMLLYILLMVSAVLSLPPSALAASEVPLAFLYEFNAGREATLIIVIGMFAVINGALIQMIMASRVLYGLSYRGQLPAQLSFVHHRTQTPVVATVLVTLIVLLLASTGSLLTLAEITSIIMLMIFSIVNLALWRIKKRDPHPPSTIIFPVWVPIIGLVISSAIVFLKLISAMS